jgi:DNA ligase (NAD+)
MEAFAEEWFPQYGGKHRLMLNGECDGAGSEVMYQDGKIVQAISRGDGYQGEDITQSALKWKGLIHEIPNFTGSIRGEFMLKESVFLEKYSQVMKTARNASAGLSKRLDGKGSEDMSFVAYDVLNRAPTQFKTELEKMQWLEACGFEVPMYELVDTLEQIEAFREKVFASRKKDIDYGCDGIVVKINDIDYDDLRRKTPMTQCAIKFKLETAETNLIGIEWSCKGRYLSPVAILTPTELDGVTVERASLSNLNKMMQMGIQIGCKVQISRHGEVIPQVDKVV